MIERIEWDRGGHGGEMLGFCSESYETYFHITPLQGISGDFRVTYYASTQCKPDLLPSAPADPVQGGALKYEQVCGSRQEALDFAEDVVRTSSLSGALCLHPIKFRHK